VVAVVVPVPNLCQFVHVVATAPWTRLQPAQEAAVVAEQ
jgi:hypothetical protein